MTEFVRTPDDNYADLADFPFEPKYHAWKDLRKLHLNQVESMLNLRITSLLTLTSSIFMKRIRDDGEVSVRHA